ncbi:unnamed protein product [Euphydryas editha]|uniref:Uncharacterized protein n=1 Tax=Euphydryas editha TaxID=104508 RepID=A0AAU9US36_EUPED|nr:unnamed protein product [Euphydryas editha]
MEVESASEHSESEAKSETETEKGSGYDTDETVTTAASRSSMNEDSDGFQLVVHKKRKTKDPSNDRQLTSIFASYNDQIEEEILLRKKKKPQKTFNKAKTTKVKRDLKAFERSSYEEEYEIPPSPESTNDVSEDEDHFSSSSCKSENENSMTG